MLPCLTLIIIKYGLMVRKAVQGKEQGPPQLFGEEAIEKGSTIDYSRSIYVCFFMYASTYVSE